MEKKKNIYLFIYLFVLLLSACNDNYCNQIIDEIDENKIKKSKNTIYLKNVFKFEWDELFICGPYGYNQELITNSDFKSKYESVNEGESLFVFLRSGKVIEEKLIRCHKISFFDNDSIAKECFKIKSANSKFLVKKVNDDNYILKKIN